MARVLIVEDDAFVGFDLAHQLARAGFTVVGVAMDVAQGLDLITNQGCDAAVLDVNLGAETAEPVAHELIARNVPFVTVSGYARHQHPSVFSRAPYLAKPVRIDRLVAELQRSISGP